MSGVSRNTSDIGGTEHSDLDNNANENISDDDLHNLFADGVDGKVVGDGRQSNGVNGKSESKDPDLNYAFVNGVSGKKAEKLAHRLEKKIMHSLKSALKNAQGRFDTQYYESESVKTMLNQGERAYNIYFGVDKKKNLAYTGITKQMFEKRLYQHNYRKNPLGPKDFVGLIGVFGDSSEILTNNMVHALEQFLIEYGPNKMNRINSISPQSEYYDSEMRWAYNFIKNYLEKNSRR